MIHITSFFFEVSQAYREQLITSINHNGSTNGLVCGLIEFNFREALLSLGVTC